MKVLINFPLSSEGPLSKAAAVAGGHSSYRTEGKDGAARVLMELDLPDDWEAFDEISGLLRGEREAGYEVDGEPVPAEELLGGLRCFLRKQRSGKSAAEWCTPRSLSGKQVFPCRQVRLYDNDHLTGNSWYAFGEMGDDGVFAVDKERITDRILSDLGSCGRCPILDLDAVAESVARLPEDIDPNRDEGWRYRGNGAVRGWSVTRTRDEEAEEPDQRESVFGRLARSVRDGASAGAPLGGASVGSRNVPETRYEDVGGMRETIALIREAVELPITHPEVFQRMGIRPHKGILFHGPPGTGKTLLARAVAHECGAHFTAVSGPEILNKYWGQSEARLRSIFADARAKAPAIILFDEIDSFAASRDAMSESFEATLVSQLLSLMDGMGDGGRVCVIATTNRVSALDPALRRPGRFDHEVEIGLPGPEARLHILNIHTRKMPTAPDLDLQELARTTGGYSGADLEALCREAALACMRRSLDLRDPERRITPRQLQNLSVTPYDFRVAMKRVAPSIRR